ncbi:MAG TPA: carboxypeptidase-like regulatory domain-containing protein [Mucilaginibacter sp.]
MTPIQKITIPQPCRQDWQLMTPVEQGRHCLQCSKTVTDFTLMTNTEILTYFTSHENVCGRFAQDQLGNINNQLDYENTKNNTGWKKWLAAMVFLGSTMFFKASAQSATTAPQIEQGVKNNLFDNGRTIGKVAVHSAVKTSIIIGHVDDEAKRPISGVTVMIPSTDISTLTDAAGDFLLQVPSLAKQLTIAHIGYASQLITINPQSSKSYEVKLRVQPMLLGKVAVVRPSLVKRLYNKCIKKTNPQDI